MERKTRPRKTALVDHCYEICEQRRVEFEGTFDLRNYSYLGVKCRWFVNGFWYTDVIL